MVRFLQYIAAFDLPRDSSVISLNHHTYWIFSFLSLFQFRPYPIGYENLFLFKIKRPENFFIQVLLGVPEGGRTLNIHIHSVALCR